MRAIHSSGASRSAGRSRSSSLASVVLPEPGNPQIRWRTGMSIFPRRRYMLNIMRYLCILALASGVPLALAADRPVPVIVELFTSEGCSSCPAADRLLTRLEQTQPVPGAQVIAIEEHVDYWNQLGWNDPFSSPQYRARQNDYAVAFHASNIYTPQMVVNGSVEFIGSDTNRAYHEIGAAAQAETTQIELGTAPNSKDPDLLDLSLRLTNPKTATLHDSNVYLAITESNLATFVQRG